MGRGGGGLGKGGGCERRIEVGGRGCYRGIEVGAGRREGEERGIEGEGRGSKGELKWGRGGGIEAGD